MQYVIHTTGRATLRFNVPAVPALAIAGTWSEPDATLLRPDPAAIAAALPYRYKRAFARHGGNFWHDKAARWDGLRQTGETAHMTLRDTRGRVMLTIYALATA